MTARAHTRWMVLSGAAILTVLPGVAGAHGVGVSRPSTPIPLSLLLGGAGGTVALTAVWLGVAVDPDAIGPRKRRLLTIPSARARWTRTISGVGFLLVVLAILVLGVTGRQVPTTNVATVVTWSLWFHGVALLTILLGSLWPSLSPWRTLYRGLSRIEGQRLVLSGRYPDWLRGWPALGGYLVLVGIVENLTVIPRSPRLTAVLVATYTFTMVGGAVLWGQSWFRWADPLGVLYRLFARVAPLEFSATDSGSYTVSIRPPWEGCLTPVRDVSTVIFVVATVYTVSFDGFTATRLYQTILFAVRDSIGTGPGTSVLLYCGGLVGFVLAFGLGSWLVERIGAGSGRAWVATTRWLAPTLLPIAIAYEIAHNYPYVARNLGQFVTLLLEPVVPSIGTIRPLEGLSLPMFWLSQVGSIVVGHVIAVVAAHAVTVDRYGSRAAARRGHVPLVILMVGYTVLSLWIISQPVVAS